ncbi:MAG: 3-dehydroquinate synthase II, partial [Methanothermobacter thermautotrophicus]
MKFAWLLAPDTYWDEKKTFITAALESGIDHIVDTADSERIKKLGNLTLISPDEDADIVLVGRDGEGDGTLELPETLEYSRDLEMASEL